MARKLTTDMPMAEMMAETPLSRYAPGEMSRMTPAQRAKMLKQQKKSSAGADLTASTVLSSGRS